MGPMPEPQRKMATVGLLMFVVGVVCMKRTGGKPLKVFGFTVLSPRAAIFLVTVGFSLVALAVMLANPEKDGARGS
jgi:hypothetical protein